MGYNELVNKITINAQRVNNEEQTKAGIIIPFLSYMGYDTTDLTKACYEQDFTDINLATVDDPSFCFIVEAKHNTSTTNKDAISQLQSYMNRNIDYYVGCVWNRHSVSFYEKGNDTAIVTIKLVKRYCENIRVIDKDKLDKLKEAIGYNEYKTENVIQLLKSLNDKSIL